MPASLWFHLPVQCPHCAGTVPLRFERIVAGGPARTSTTYAAECASCHASVRATIDGTAPVADVLLEAARAPAWTARGTEVAPMASARVLALRAAAGMILSHLETPDPAPLQALTDGPSVEEIRTELRTLAGRLMIESARADAVTAIPDGRTPAGGRVFVLHQVDAGDGHQGGGSSHG